MIRWTYPVGVAAFFMLIAVAKFIAPRQAILSKLSWSYLAATCVLLAGAVTLLSNQSIAGYWTVPASIGLGFLYCLVHMSLGPGDDGPPAKR
ncbi:hypothetical protein [Terricaulis sp.]|uniref:hypothetical protein n=1 Tax=Terricaulis sp. TaxID=2768686 RepID=UPI00378403D8